MNLFWKFLIFQELCKRWDSLEDDSLSNEGDSLIDSVQYSEKLLTQYTIDTSNLKLTRNIPSMIIDSRFMSSDGLYVSRLMSNY